MTRAGVLTDATNVVITRLEAERDLLSDNEARLQAVINNLKDQVNTWEENHIDCQEQADRITHLEEELGQWKCRWEGHQDCDNIIACLRRQLDEHKKCSGTLESAQKQLEDHRNCGQTIEQLQQESARLETECCKSAATIKGLGKKRDRGNEFEATAKTLQEKCEAQQAVITTLRKQAEVFKTTIETLKKDYKVRKAENNVLQKQRTAHETTVETLQQERQGHVGKMNDLRAQLAGPNLYRRCEENITFLEKQLELQQSAMGQEAPPEPVMAKNMALKNAIKQVDKDVVSLCNNLRNLMASFKRPEEIKEKYLQLGRVISNWRQGNIMRQTETNNLPVSLENLIKEALISYDIISTYHMRMTDILRTEMEKIKMYEQIMQSLQKRHDMLRQDFSTLLGKAEEEKDCARTRESKLWEMIELRNDMIQLREEIIIRLLESLNSEMIPNNCSKNVMRDFLFNPMGGLAPKRGASYVSTFVHSSVHLTHFTSILQNQSHRYEEISADVQLLKAKVLNGLRFPIGKPSPMTPKQLFICFSLSQLSDHKKSLVA
ncbi:hypothetical protein COCMIDRAFT_21584 [Bipolaris oryzae ATCC 44560]|uniref:Uncharacterized protein n=1 Tax=Bipolaris oryzae ATCC 44560 TaxID=930090 RepID=W6ZTJ4_COCMI|nr:uncharacterized protein COCMIDRAFT_21584 [Bipolaris oryzae ATCC 44560]EUC50864.1 hypothetical protein COCMIDRAFT_21584 [Bipolaris oryzae ATCC 44560]